MLNNAALAMASRKGKDWADFSHMVFLHIENYVVNQYGDKGEDQVAGYTVEDVKKQIEKYAARIGKSARGQEEAIRDCLKLAHYSQILHHMLCGDAYVSNEADIRISDEETLKNAAEADSKREAIAAMRLS